jgi:hypothetical protein
MLTLRLSWFKFGLVGFGYMKYLCLLKLFFLQE